METNNILTLTMNPAVDKYASVDHVAPERKLRCKSPHFEPGGGGINVSRAIKKLGGDSKLLYTASGPIGNLLEELLDQEQLDHQKIPIAGMTRENLIVYEEASGLQYRFGMPGPYLHENEWRRCLEILTEVWPQPGYIVASGSLPPGVPDDFYAQAAQLARKLGNRFIVDSSGKPLASALEEGLFLLKANMRELEELAGKPLSTDAQIENEVIKILQNGQSKMVVISLGAGGALAAWAEEVRWLRAPTVPIKSKVGAGDSMVAGMVLALSRNYSKLDAVRYGLAAGSAAVMTAGTELCRKEDTQKLFEQMKSEKAA